jgi:hypothetical protein
VGEGRRARSGAGIVKINVDIRGIEAVQKKLRGLSEKMRQEVLSPAINKAAKKAQVEVNRAIREDYFVKADEVRNAISLRQARRDDLQAVIDVFGSKSRRGRSANMIRFLAVLQAAGFATKTRGAVGVTKSDVRKLGAQLGFRVRRDGGVKQIKGAFVANKGRTVFIRTGDKRLPIKPVQVIGFSQMFASKKISRRVMAKVDRDLIVEVDRALKRLFSR